MEETKTKSLETIALNNYVALKCTLPCSPPKNSICSGRFSASKIIYRVLMFSFSISMSFSYSTTEMLSCTALTALSQPHKLVTATHFLHQAKPQAHSRFPFKTLLPLFNKDSLFWLSHLFFFCQTHNKLHLQGISELSYIKICHFCTRISQPEYLAGCIYKPYI